MIDMSESDQFEKRDARIVSQINKKLLDIDNRLEHSRLDLVKYPNKPPRYNIATQEEFKALLIQIKEMLL